MVTFHNPKEFWSAKLLIITQEDDAVGKVLLAP
jgi:hypothetical protein